MISLTTIFAAAILSALIVLSVNHLSRSWKDYKADVALDLELSRKNHDACFNEIHTYAMSQGVYMSEDYKTAYMAIRIEVKARYAID